MGPLENLTIVEMCGPLGEYAAKLLGDMGANVIKVELPTGSPSRKIGPFVDDIPGPNRSLNFFYHNTNKRSVVLDYRNSEEDRNLLLDLIHEADLVIEDHVPDDLPSLGIQYEEIAKRNTGLLWCSITPYGLDGPWSQYGASDMTALAAGGQMSMNGYSPEDVPDAPPIHGKGDLAYKTASHYAVIGTLVALRHRLKSGEGQLIDCSMHEALSSTTEVGLPYWLYTGKNILRQTSRHASVQRTDPWQFPTADEKYILVFGTGRSAESWLDFKKWLQNDGFGLQLDDARFDDPLARQGGRGTTESKEINSELAKFIASKSAEEIYRGAQARRLPWGTVREPHEILEDNHFRSRGHLVSVSISDENKEHEMPGAPYHLSSTPWELRLPAPELGEHTDDVLGDLQDHSLRDR